MVLKKEKSRTGGRGKLGLGYSLALGLEGRNLNYSALRLGEKTYTGYMTIAKPKREAEGTAGWTAGTARRILAWWSSSGSSFLQCWVLY